MRASCSYLSRSSILSRTEDMMPIRKVQNTPEQRCACSLLDVAQRSATGEAAHRRAPSSASIHTVHPLFTLSVSSSW